MSHIAIRNKITLTLGNASKCIAKVNKQGDKTHLHNTNNLRP